jgi:mono/diheme cytochrome c family protein
MGASRAPAAPDPHPAGAVCLPARVPRVAARPAGRRGARASQNDGERDRRRSAQVYSALGKPYTFNAYDLSQGKRLYAWFGCPACHGDGRGGSGPPLLDSWWQYGPDVVSIFVSIRDGRPGGMPAFRDKLNTEQLWQLTGYVQTLGAYSTKTGAPSRDDAPHTRPAENRAPAAILFDTFPEIR